MTLFKRLRWRLIIAPLLVAIVGTACMLFLTYVIVFQFAPDLLSRELSALVQNPSQIEETQAALLRSFQLALVRSVLIACFFALVTGVVYSYILWSSLVVPLRHIAESSQRIASGRYEERVQIPRQSMGVALTQLVTNFNHMAAALESIEYQRVTLIGNVTHELRTPLTSLRGYLEGLQDGLFEPNEETLGILEQEVDRLSRLVQDIQILSRVEAGAVELEIHSFDLGEIVDQIVFRFQPQARQKKIELTARHQPLLVAADWDRTVQILTNLVGNALRYTPEGGLIELVVKRVNEGEPMGAVVVNDTGIGIPAEALPYVFERFYRVDGSRSRESGGSGVGLTISRHLAWMMKGELTVFSAGEGCGSTFVLKLPLAGSR